MMLLRNIAPGNIAVRIESRLLGAVLLRQADGNGDGGLRSADRRPAHGRNSPFANARMAGVGLVGAEPAEQPEADRDDDGCPWGRDNGEQRWQVHGAARRGRRDRSADLGRREHDLGYRGQARSRRNAR